MFAVSALLVVAATAQAAEWSVDSRAQATIVCGVGAMPNSDASAMCGVGQSGVGEYANVYNTAADKWTKSDNVAMMMVMDAAMSADAKTQVIVGMGVSVSTDSGSTFTKNTQLLGVSQAVYTYGDNKNFFATVGDLTLKSASGAPVSVSGVATSTDGGQTFALSAEVPEGCARYGAFPSESTWFISQGIWDTSSQTEAEKQEYVTLSAHMSRNKKSGALKMTRAGASARWLADTNATTSGWWGAVSKTTDGGKTFTQVLRTNPVSDFIYFNQIDCSSELNCVVVGEGQAGADGGDATVAYATSDGGNSWALVKSGDADVSLMAVKFSSASVAWMGGVGYDGRKAVGQFSQSTDGGKTWALVQTLDGCVPMDIDFGAAQGVAACVSATGGSSTVAFYK